MALKRLYKSKSGKVRPISDKDRWPGEGIIRKRKGGFAVRTGMNSRSKHERKFMAAINRPGTRQADWDEDNQWDRF